MSRRALTFYVLIVTISALIFTPTAAAKVVFGKKAGDRITVAGQPFVVPQPGGIVTTGERTVVNRGGRVYASYARSSSVVESPATHTPSPSACSDWTSRLLPQSTGAGMQRTAHTTWYLKGSTVPAGRPLDDVRGAIGRGNLNWRNGDTTCQLVAEYDEWWLNFGSYTPAGDSNVIAGTGGCAASDLDATGTRWDVVSFKDLPTGVAAQACIYGVAKQPGDGVLEHIAYRIVESDFSFNTDLNWRASSTGCGSPQYYMEDVATHEFGHWHGLGHPLPEGEHTNLTMGGYAIICDTRLRTLGLGDIDGMYAIYGD